MADAFRLFKKEVENPNKWLKSSVSAIFSCRQGEGGEEGDADPAIHQIPDSDQCPQEKKEAPGESDSSCFPPKVPETKKDERKEEADEEEVKPQLSSSVTIDMADVHSSLELSTIAGTSGICGVPGFSNVKPRI